jgi:sorbitol-specific phosphotransferase system component IIA
VLRSGYVLRVGSVQRLHQLDAEAGTVREEHRELGHLTIRFCSGHKKP